MKTSQSALPLADSSESVMKHHNEGEVSLCNAISNLSMVMKHAKIVTAYAQKYQLCISIKCNISNTNAYDQYANAVHNYAIMTVHATCEYEHHVTQTTEQPPMHVPNY